MDVLIAGLVLVPVSRYMDTHPSVWWGGGHSGQPSTGIAGGRDIARGSGVQIAWPQETFLPWAVCWSRSPSREISDKERVGNTMVMGLLPVPALQRMGQ